MKIGKKGFTLTELLVVVMVIAILASIAVPLYTRTIRKSYASDAMSVLSAAAQRQENYFINNGKYADGFTQLGAPIKGLDGDKTTSEAGVVVGNFKYLMSDGCVAAVSMIGDKASDADDYVIYKNFTTQQEGCVGKGCDMLEGIIDHVSSAGCTLVTTASDDDDISPTTDPCVVNPASCCPEGTTWNGTKCVGMECPAGKVYDSLNKTCVCGFKCVNGLGTQDPDTCACTCTNTCPGGQTQDTSCNCSCPSSLPNWNAATSTCTAACPAPKTRWNGATGQCECPIDKPLFAGSTCVSCPMGKPWNDTTKTCACPDGLPYEWSDGSCKACAQSGAASLKAACESTASGPAGTWTDVMCSCDCQQQNSVYSGGHCVCPPSQPNWNGSSCIACTGDTPIWDGTKCISAAKTCPTSSRPLSSEVCSTCGTKTRTVTCNTTTGTWTTGDWGACDKSGCLQKGDCCCNGQIEIKNSAGLDCSSFNYKPRLLACHCKQDYCDEDDAALCGDCGGVWNSSKCTCDCGSYKGNSCRFVSGKGCLCGNLYRACR